MRHEIRLQGIGGQGIITAGRLLGEAASLHERKEAIMTEDYSPYVTGGWSRADLIISDEPIDYPLVTEPEILCAMSQDGLEDNWERTSKDATIIVETRYMDSRALKGRRLINVPALSISEELGNKVVANVVMLGVLAAETHIVGREALETAIANRYPKAVELNQRAFSRGYNYSSQDNSR
jgi:2-oxoglutarate ferredoxin oxidoreductase subunit gamma